MRSGAIRIFSLKFNMVKKYWNQLPFSNFEKESDSDLPCPGFYILICSWIEVFSGLVVHCQIFEKLSVWNLRS